MREDDRSLAERRFEMVYDRCYPRVAAFCQRRLPADQADDAIAETFVVAWRRIDDVPEGAAALLWLYRVAHRTVGHHWRSRDRRTRLHTRLHAVPEDVTAGPEETAVSSVEVERVLRAADRLNDNDAEVLRLLCWENLDRDEIAEVLELTPNAVSQRIHRARRHLAKELARLEREDHRRGPVPGEGATS